MSKAPVTGWSTRTWLLFGAGAVAGVWVGRRLITMPFSQVFFEGRDAREIQEIVDDVPEGDDELDGGGTGNAGPGLSWTLPVFGGVKLY